MIARIVAIGILLHATHAAAAPCAEADAQALRTIKLETWPAIYRQQDVAALDALLLDGARTVDAAGAVSSKADELDWLRKNAWTPHDFTYRIDVMECHGDTAIVIGEGRSVDNENGRRMQTTYVSSNWFARDGGRWRVAGSHLAPSKTTPLE